MKSASKAILFAIAMTAAAAAFASPDDGASDNQWLMDPQPVETIPPRVSATTTPTPAPSTAKAPAATEGSNG